MTISAKAADSLITGRHRTPLRVAPAAGQASHARPTVVEVASPRAYELLGGASLMKKRPITRADVHAVIVRGIPYTALFHLTDRFTTLSELDVANVVGVSTRTLRRQKDDPKKAMPTDLASKTWHFAETLAKATDVFGSRQEAERWMSQEAMGLDGARPIELMCTLQGAELVSEFLGRLEHGVYN
jgi:putative toxin-antitoxin system antitoxin component (TIGR02293 family)